MCACRVYVRANACVKRARTNRRVSTDREASGKETIAVATARSVDPSAFIYTLALRSHHVPGHHRDRTNR